MSGSKGSRGRWTGLLGVVLALVVTGCGGSAPSGPAAPSITAAGAAEPAAPRPGPLRLGDAPAYVAVATKDITAHSRPRGSGSIVAVFPAKLPWGSPTSFLIQEAYRDAANRTWLRVILPRRPNGTTGWIRQEQVRLLPVVHQVEVDLSSRTARLLRDGRTERSWPVGIGRDNTPTPTGRFYITVKLRPPQISRVYGAWALGISGYSDVLDQFGTGDGQIALHGTSDPSDLGREVSNGCIRLANDAITSLAETLPLGSPVTIRP